MLAQIVDMIELVRLQIGARGVDVGQGRFAQYAGGDVLDREIRDFMMKLMFLYSPDAIRETTSRRVISGSTTASRPRRP